MAGGMPLRNVSKGPVFRKIDKAFLSAVNRVDALLAYAEAQTAQDKMNVFLDQAKNLKILSNTATARIMRDWLDDQPPSWWPNYEYKLQILAEGFRKALEVSLGPWKELDIERPLGKDEIVKKKVDVGGNADYGKPVASMWICAGHHFQCVVMDAEKQVTLLLLTPSVPSSAVPDRPMTKHQDMWIVSNKADHDALKKAATYPGGPHKIPDWHEQILGVFVTGVYGEEDGAYDDPP